MHYLLALSLSLLLLCCDTCPAQVKWEKRFPFKWDKELHTNVIEVYRDSSKFFFRLAQIYSESAFNPLATSDFGGWKASGLDTAQAIYQRKGAAGLTQFIWPTAKSLGAQSVNPRQATVDTFSFDLYNPLWSLQACCRYMKSIEILMLRTKNPKAKRKLIINEEFSELCATAGYNTGPGKLLKQLNKNSNWQVIRLRLLEEPRLYSEKIIVTEKEMRVSARWYDVLKIGGGALIGYGASRIGK